MAGLVPAIHALSKEGVDARHKAGHDGFGWLASAIKRRHLSGAL
jgi:hypothetical protein